MIEIKTGNVPCCVYVSNVEEHVTFKKWFLKYIKDIPAFGVREDGGTSIYNTDFWIREFHTDYRDNVSSIINMHNSSLTNLLGYQNDPLKTSWIWYQQYKKGDSHVWHRHGGVFSNVYYVDLQEGTSNTTFRYMGNEFQVEVNEGQILTFPSFLEHCSKPNSSENIKTVISFNTD